MRCLVSSSADERRQRDSKLPQAKEPTPARSRAVNGFHRPSSRTTARLLSAPAPNFISQRANQRAQPPSPQSLSISRCVSPATHRPFPRSNRTVDHQRRYRSPSTDSLRSPPAFADSFPAEIPTLVTADFTGEVAKGCLRWRRVSDRRLRNPSASYATSKMHPCGTQYITSAVMLSAVKHLGS